MATPTKSPLIPVETLVRMDGDGYITATVRGKRAACTWSDDEAVRRLGTKLFAEHLDHVERLPDQPGDRDARIYSRWRIVPKEVLHESA